MSNDMDRLVKWHNGEKEYSPFSDAEMSRRQNDVRKWMSENDVGETVLDRCSIRMQSSLHNVSACSEDLCPCPATVKSVVIKPAATMNVR